MKVRHKSLVSTKLLSSMGEISLDANGLAEVTKEVGEHLLASSPGWGLPLGVVAKPKFPNAPSPKSDKPRQKMRLPNLEDFLLETGLDEEKYEAFLEGRRAEAELLGMDVVIEQPSDTGSKPTPPHRTKKGEEPKTLVPPFNPSMVAGGTGIKDRDGGLTHLDPNNPIGAPGSVPGTPGLVLEGVDDKELSTGEGDEEGKVQMSEEEFAKLSKEAQAAEKQKRADEKAAKKQAAHDAKHKSK